MSEIPENTTTVTYWLMQKNIYLNCSFYSCTLLYVASVFVITFLKKRNTRANTSSRSCISSQCPEIIDSTLLFHRCCNTWGDNKGYFYSILLADWSIADGLELLKWLLFNKSVPPRGFIRYWLSSRAGLPAKTRGGASVDWAPLPLCLHPAASPAAARCHTCIKRGKSVDAVSRRRREAESADGEPTEAARRALQPQGSEHPGPKGWRCSARYSCGTLRSPWLNIKKGPSRLRKEDIRLTNQVRR